MKDHILLSNSFAFLAECFCFPSQEQIDFLSNFEHQVYEDVLALKEALKNEDALELQRDFSKLFVGPFDLQASPYGSVYLEQEKSLFGESTEDVVRFYQEENLDIKSNNVPDYIGLELEFIYYLQGRKIELLHDGLVDKSLEYAKKQKNFMQNHICLWVDKFSAKLYSNAQTSFFRNLGTLLPRQIKHLITKVQNDLNNSTIHAN
ncbi:MAG: molecular chaperone TorD family protein [Bacteroidetes bacterium]|jgi:putative dimethyl sulfoxide reductase chaperone|nr:molecular chaperone TorD family protein [Bacteroidota bacterium]MBT6685591.1 molecular chaperone TorD family protein [Bacteroidota bacterium]MBT7142680.1 molecular chaperone TorD family protein [Bacteroidota bacterium]MBT7490918.1 molecular chaperone TorD family protein [Bacteroidota bacterium]